MNDKMINGGEKEKERNSNFELFRIILMLFIIAHHYTVNSGLVDMFNFSSITINMIFLQIFGMFGKTIINCFTIITGYFMVKSNISYKKLLRVYLEVKFYYILFYFIFVLTGYEMFSIKNFIKTVLNVVYESGGLYTGTYIIFFLFIPFLNILANNMTKIQYGVLLFLSISYYTIFSTFLSHETFDFLSWMFVTYLIGGYIRLYPNKIFTCKMTSFCGLVITIICMIVSVLAIDFIGSTKGFTDFYFFVANSHKIFALMCSIFSFLFFTNVKIKQNKFINVVASSTFGILLFHTNSDTMRRFLWQDVFRNTSFYYSEWLPIHAIGAVLVVFLVGLLIDQVRIRLIEKPLLKWFEKTKLFYKMNMIMERLL